METAKFRFGVAALRRSNQRLAVTLILLPVLILLVMLVQPVARSRIADRLGFTAAFLSAVNSVIWLGWRGQNKRMAGSELELGPEAVSLTYGPAVEKIYYAGITGLTIRHVPSGKVSAIHVISDSDQRLLLQGFDGMDEIARSLLERVSSQNVITRRQDPLDWSASWVWAAVIAATGAAVLLILLPGGTASEIIQSAVFAGMGGWLVVSRPITKMQGRKYAAYDLSAGGLMLIYAFVILAGLLQ